MNFRKPSKSVEYVISAIAVAPALYWAFTESGPFRALLALEREKLGWASDKLTVLALVFAIYLPLRLFVALRTDERAGEAAADAAAAPHTETRLKSALLAYGASALLVAFAAGTHVYHRPTGPAVSVKASDFRAGRIADGTLVAIAAATEDNALRIKRGGEERLYIPLSEAPVIVSIDADRKDQTWTDDVVNVTGIVSVGVSNILRDDLQSVGIAVPEKAWTVVQQKDPRFMRNLTLALIAFGVAMGPFIYWMRRRAYAAGTTRIIPSRAA